MSMAALLLSTQRQSSAKLGSGAPLRSSRLLAEAPNGTFYPSCAHGDYGWPRFDTAADLAAAPGWATYLRHIYGEDPSTFPICTYDLWWVDEKVLSGTAAEHPPPLPRRVQHFFDDSFFSWEDGDLFEKATDWKSTYYDTANGGGYAIYHSYRDGLYAGSNQWIEVIHKCGSSACGTGGTGENVGMWFSFAPGSGIWYFTGKHAVFNNHSEASWSLCGYEYKSDDDTAGCGTRLGLDSYSFRTSRPVPAGPACIQDYAHCRQPPTYSGTLSTWGMVGLYELVGLRGQSGAKLAGRWPCGTREGGITGGFRAGWRASRLCDCLKAGSAARPGWLNCVAPPAPPAPPPAPPLPPLPPASPTPPAVDFWSLGMVVSLTALTGLVAAMAVALVAGRCRRRRVRTAQAQEGVQTPALDTRLLPVVVGEPVLEDPGDAPLVAVAVDSTPPDAPLVVVPAPVAQ